MGRVDVKADRKNKILEAKAAFIEPTNDVDEVAFAMAKTLKEMAQWLQLDTLKVGRKGNLARALASANR